MVDFGRVLRDERRRKPQLERIREARVHLMALLPERLHGTYTPAGQEQKWTFLEHAKNYQPRMYGVLPAAEVGVKECMDVAVAQLELAVNAMLEDEAAFLLDLAGSKHAGEMFMAARRALLGDTHIPYNYGAFLRYMRAVLRHVIAASEKGERVPVKAGRKVSVRREELGDVPAEKQAVTAEDSHVQNTQEMDPRWREFFGYEEQEG